MPVFNLSPRLGAGGVIALVVVLGLIGVGTVASAEPADQAALATPTATGIPVTCVTVPAGVQIILENPNPGDTIVTGTPVQINGIAFDNTAPTGTGVSSVTVYLGDRNAGGIALGTALLGQSNPQAGSGSQFATAGFSLRTPNLPVGSGSRTIFVYAKSSVTNQEAILQVPVYLNVAPTPVKGLVPTAVLPPPVACTPTPVPTATPVPAAPAAPAAPVVAAPPAAATVGLISTPTPFPTLPPLPAPAAPAAAPAAAPKPQAAVPVAAVPAAAQTTAPRGGGIPPEFGLALLAAGALVAGGGMVLRRRQLRQAVPEERDSASTL